MLLPDILEDLRRKLEILLMHISYENNEILIEAIREIEAIQEDVGEAEDD